jgi:hypothetical protein
MVYFLKFLVADICISPSPLSFLIKLKWVACHGKYPIPCSISSLLSFLVCSVCCTRFKNISVAGDYIPINKVRITSWWNGLLLFLVSHSALFYYCLHLFVLFCLIVSLPWIVFLVDLFHLFHCNVRIWNWFTITNINLLV